MGLFSGGHCCSRLRKVCFLLVMEVSFEISGFGLEEVSCKMTLQRAVHQMNALSHLGFLIQMYIAHLMDDLSQAEELAKLRRQKELIESMHSVSRRECEQISSQKTAERDEAEQMWPPAKAVSFQDEESGCLEEESPDLPSCNLDASILESSQD